MYKFACPEIPIFAKISSEMKKLTAFALFCAGCIGIADAAVRDANSSVRAASASQRVTTTPLDRTKISARTATGTTQTRGVTSRGAITTTPATARTATTRNIASKPTTTTGDTRTGNATSRTTAARSATTATATKRGTATTARAADTTTTVETRTGAAYEQCKNAYFTCMDQFCQLKNDDYRRCSCSNRVYELTDMRTTIQEAGEQLTVFTENLDVVGMSAAQAAAMKNASDGENALTADTSASKALLQAIMNSIRGEDSTVGGKYSDLNSINISFDTTNAFGMSDAGQAVAAYNGQSLYTAVYPQCRSAVMADCNDASLQRAVTAYLMAIEQDCNTVATAITEKQKQMKSAIREGSAMLDLARVENRQNRNSDDITTCLNNVEAAILSEEVCGPGYRKCLDNGQFIDVTTGTPIAGVVNFYELGNLLKFNTGTEISQQKLAQMSGNKTFVQNFEKRTKKFAQPSLDKCTEQADTVWSEYLDKAMLDIYYAQQAKVTEIKQGCFDFVSACYMNGDTALTAAMKELTGDSAIVLQPDKIALNQALCTDYVKSCNNMFDGDIVAQYVENRKDTDTLTACRAIVKQCFTNYGGTTYENFYYPYSGVFDKGNAPDWFTLYEIKDGGSILVDEELGLYGEYKSECAKQLTTIDACNNKEIIEKAFGGFDSANVYSIVDSSRGTVWTKEQLGNTNRKKQYGLFAQQKINTDNISSRSGNTAEYIDATVLRPRALRSTGVATETYNQLIDILTTHCTNLQGRYVQPQLLKEALYNANQPCLIKVTTTDDTKNPLDGLAPWGLADGEDMCPRNYELQVDTQSWGACLCWENGGRRSKWGKSAKCIAALPTKEPANEASCNNTYTIGTAGANKEAYWCTITPTALSQVCATAVDKNTKKCMDDNGKELDNLPEGLN